MREIAIDSETTGLEVEQGHRLIEIGMAEIIDGNITGHTYHQYINPEFKMDPGATGVHGISNAFLQDKPIFSEIADELLAFLGSADLVAHNAPFDIRFLNKEMAFMGRGNITKSRSVIDTLSRSREIFPTQPNTMNALCERLDINYDNKTSRGALLGAEICAEIYLKMLRLGKFSQK